GGFRQRAGVGVVRPHAGDDQPACRGGQASRIQADRIHTTERRAGLKPPHVLDSSDPLPPPTTAHRVAQSIDSILHRPVSERVREYKYRFAQSLVFGLPVLALSLFGPALGGPEAGRWIGLLQSLLAGWVMYVGVTGMLVEALMRRRLTLDGLV